jgi:hypothetical protein
VPSTTRSSAVVLALVVLLAAGCGSKSAKQRYADKLSAMCANFAARERKITAPTGPADVAARGDRIVRAFEETIMRPILSLAPPPGLRPTARRLRTLAVQQRDALRGLAAAARAGDIQRLQLLAQRNRRLNADAGRIARELKADSCAS